MAGAFNELLEDLFEPVGGVSLRRMFGGIGVFKDGVMFGLVDDDVLYLKADDATRPRFEAESSEPWVYQSRHRANVSTAYWRIPERLLDDTDEFAAWARTAFAVAARLKGAKAKPSRKPRVVAKKAVGKKAVAKKSVAKKMPPTKKKTALKRR